LSPRGVVAVVGDVDDTSIFPRGVAVDSNDGMYIGVHKSSVSQIYDYVEQFDASGNSVGVFETLPDASDTKAIVFDAAGNLYVGFQGYVQRYNQLGSPAGIAADFAGAEELAVSPTGVLYVARGGTVAAFGANGESQLNFSVPGDVQGMAFDKSGVLYVSTGQAFPNIPSAIRRYTADGEPLGTIVERAIPAGFTDILIVDVVPEPSTIALFAIGGAAIGYRRRRAG
jgi:sugar lactone lactonase YvrE